MTTRRKLRYPVKVHEGDLYAVPLRNGGYGFGVITRTGRSGALFGYFFGPRQEKLPTLDNVRALRPEDAVSCELFGDLGIQNGEWPFIGRLDTWNRDEWPLPEFGRIDEISGLAWVDRYDDKDVSRRIGTRKCSLDEARALPPNSWAGYGAVEIGLTDKLMEAPAPLAH